MSKALVIRGANFFANRVDVVTLQTVVPCDSIVLSHSVIDFTAIGATQQLTATVLPADTTESVIWISSDENCVTVVDGLVSCVGVGTATITATCGDKSATCAVTANVIVNADTAYTSLNGVMSNSTELSSNPPKDYISANASNRGRIYYNAQNTLGGLKAYIVADDAAPLVSNTYPIPLPTGTQHISIAKPTGVGYLRIVAFVSSEHPTNPNVTSTVSRVVAAVYSLASDSNAELDIPQGADSFAFAFYTSSGYTADQITSPISVVFS